MRVLEQKNAPPPACLGLRTILGSIKFPNQNLSQISLGGHGNDQTYKQTNIQTNKYPNKDHYYMKIDNQAYRALCAPLIVFTLRIKC